MLEYNCYEEIDKTSEDGWKERGDGNRGYEVRAGQRVLGKINGFGVISGVILKPRAMETSKDL